MMKNLLRFAAAVALVAGGLTSTGCSNHTHSHYAGCGCGGYYHSPHAYRAASHHVHYSGCGHSHAGVSYHYY